MKANLIRGKSPEEIQVALTECMDDGFKPTLALVFLSIKHDYFEICEFLDKEEIKIFGTTTHGEIADDETSVGEISILLLDLDEAYFKAFLYELNQNNPIETSKNIAA